MNDIILLLTVGRVFALSSMREATIEDSAANCGVATDCGVHAFAVRLHTGVENIELPKICVNGK